MKNRDDRETALERNALRLRRERECRQNGRKRERESKVERNSRRIVPRASNFRNSIQNRPCHPSFLSSPREGGEYLERGSVNSSLRTIRHPERKQRIPRKRTGKQVPSLFPNRCAVEFQRNIRGERRRKKERKPSLNNKNRPRIQLLHAKRVDFNRTLFSNDKKETNFTVRELYEDPFPPFGERSGGAVHPWDIYRDRWRQLEFYRARQLLLGEATGVRECGITRERAEVRSKVRSRRDRCDVECYTRRVSGDKRQEARGESRRR